MHADDDDDDKRTDSCTSSNFVKVYLREYLARISGITPSVARNIRLLRAPRRAL
jgi:hypothetical protein